MIDRNSLRIRRRKGLKMCKIYCINNPSDRHIGRFGTTPVSCSCWMCGNYRKHHGKTLQEIRSSQPEE